MIVTGPLAPRHRRRLGNAQVRIDCNTVLLIYRTPSHFQGQHPRRQERLWTIGQGQEGTVPSNRSIEIYRNPLPIQGPSKKGSGKKKGGGKKADVVSKEKKSAKGIP